MSPIKMAVLISGGGTNLQAIIEAIEDKVINGEIKAVISNKQNAYGLERARLNNIDACFIDRNSFDNNKEYNNEILRILENKDIDLVVLAGYLQILSTKLVSKYQNKIINIHPSLIPSFCGKGFYGENVHKSVLDYGVKVTGATVHFVDEGTDTGPIILQEVVKVEDDDTVESLQKKVLSVEHKVLVEAIKLFCENELKVEGRRVLINR
ncbi:phosphoribosylglycinamide formyltransferase [Sporosalibacterium faouarense]|uniref:phosphoribosylglycinamide formyltransferase n=1 Tax=Sporosalibacterium faouarense TaxID=516123 RepID=UPI00192BD492|nr:phosphoribosylglycinamide formyltransferase [Sporosalibacterium faouarense]